ncbi:hypothetical protein NG795_10665 [Laspinema sp. D3]|nr:hypothetical protein [Laspinema sp. D2c]
MKPPWIPDVPELGIHEGENVSLDTVLDLGDWGELRATPGGPVDPMDCKNWPGSPFCEGDLLNDPRDTGVSVDNISVSECEIIITFKMNVLGFEMPTFQIAYSTGKCDEKPPQPEEPPPPLPEYPFPPDEEPGNSENVRFNCKTINLVVWHNDGNANGARWRAYIRDSPPKYEPPFGEFTVPRFTWGNSQPIRVYFERWQHYLKNDDGSYRRSATGQLIPANTSFKLGRKGGIDFYYHTLSGMEGPRSFAAAITVDEEVAEAGYSPSQVIEWIRALNPVPRARVYGSGALESLDYLFGDDTPAWDAGVQATWRYWALWSPNRNNCKWTKRKTGPHSQMNNDCCDASKAALRRLKRIEAVLQPDKFLKFDEKGNPEKILGKFPRRLVSPADSNGVVGFFKNKALKILGKIVGYDFDASKYIPIAGYSDALSAITKQVDRMGGFWPTTVEIEDIDPGTEGNQPFSMQIHSVSDGFKQALEALAHLVARSAPKNSPDSDEDPTLRILGAILTEVGLTHKITAITNQTTNNIEEFLDYKVRQQEDFLPMAFNPLATLPNQGKEYTKPTEEEVNVYLKKLLRPSTHEIIVTKIDQDKLLTEWLLELLKHSSSASAALTQQISSKEDLKKALGTARLNALVQGALNMEQIRRVLGLPSNWDMKDFSERLEDNFHPDENVESGLHSETKPKQAKEKPRIKDISKNGRRRKR